MHTALMLERDEYDNMELCCDTIICIYRKFAIVPATYYLVFSFGFMTLMLTAMQLTHHTSVPVMDVRTQMGVSFEDVLEQYHYMQTLFQRDFSDRMISINEHGLITGIASKSLLDAGPEARRLYNQNRAGRPLPECGRNKSCLENNFRQVAVQRALDMNPDFWRHWLNATSFPYTYTRSSVYCSNHSKSLLIYIHSNPTHLMHRTIIRQTWGSITYFKGVSISLIFLLGLPANQAIQDTITAESYLYGDIVQGSFNDTYKNLTLKNRMGLEWVYKYCPNSDYVLKMDDDVFVNIFRVVDWMLEIMPLFTEPTFVCTVAQFRLHTNRDINSKWYTTPEEYPQEWLPDFCPGRAYIIPTTLAMRMHIVTSEVRFLWLDDVWATGLLGNLTGAKHAALSHDWLLPTSLNTQYQHCFFDLPGNRAVDADLLRFAHKQWNLVYDDSVVKKRSHPFVLPCS